MFFLANYGKLWRENLDILQPTNFPMSNWVFPKMGIPNLDGFIMENPIKVDDLGGKHHYFRFNIQILNGSRVADFFC